MNSREKGLGASPRLLRFVFYFLSLCSVSRVNCERFERKSRTFPAPLFLVMCGQRYQLSKSIIIQVEWVKGDTKAITFLKRQLLLFSTYIITQGLACFFFEETKTQDCGSETSEILTTGGVGTRESGVQKVVTGTAIA